MIRLSIASLPLALLIGVIANEAQRPVYRVGPGQRFAELHHIPPVVPGVKVEIFWRPEPYKSKLAVAANRVQIAGIPGPNGERPEINGDGAIEVPWAKYWSSQVSDKGVITIAPAIAGERVRGVRIEGIKLSGARNGRAGFTNAAGQAAGWSTAVAGIAMYRAEHVTIRDCELAENNNGLFATTDGAGGIVSDVMVDSNHFRNNGVPGSFHYHNAYVEALRTTYQFNRFDSPKSGSAGANLKDRSAGLVVRHNHFRGGARMLDAVDPETGGPQFVQTPEWRSGDYVYGNVWVNPHATTPMHFGYDGQAEFSRHTLYWYFNTAVNVNTQQGGRWRTVWFKTEGVPKIHVANSIFHNWSPSGGNPGEMWLLTEEYSSGTRIDLKANWFTDHTQMVYSAGGAPTNAMVNGWDQRLKGPDPKFADITTEDLRLDPDSTCRHQAIRLGLTGWPLKEHMPSHSYDPPTGTWQDRPSRVDLGANEFIAGEPRPSAPEPEPDPLLTAKPLEFSETVALDLTAWKAEHGDTPEKPWWPWGVVAADFTGDGKVDLAVTQHNTWTRVWRNTGAGFEPYTELPGRTYRPLAWDFTGDGRPDLFFRTSGSKTAFVNKKGLFEAVPCAYCEAEPSLSLCTVAGNTLTHDSGKWEWNGAKFNRIPYTNPAEATLPDSVAQLLADARLKSRPTIRRANGKDIPNPVFDSNYRSLRTWYVAGSDMTALAGFASYSPVRFGRWVRDGADATAALGLPADGTPIAAGDWNRDGKSDWLVTGKGYYLSLDGTYKLQDGPLTDALTNVGTYVHQVIVADFNRDQHPDLVVLNPRGKSTRVFAGEDKGGFKEVLSVPSWDGEPVSVVDMNGDGLPDLAVGTGITVKLFLTRP